MVGFITKIIRYHVHAKKTHKINNLHVKFVTLWNFSKRGEFSYVSFKL